MTSNAALPIGGLPPDWRVGRLKDTVASAKNGVWGDEPDGTSADIPCVRVADFDRISFRASEAPTIRSVAPSQRRGRILRRGDLLLEKSGGGEKQPVGCVVTYVSDQLAVCSNFVARVEVSPPHHSRFLTYLHAALYFAGVSARNIKQTTGIQNLDASAYFDERVPLPPEGSQRVIADFLDRKTAAIDALIEKKERLIALLQEKRQALITQAVTKGLDPSVPMKDSGIEWLGEIPAHWSCAPIYSRYEVQLGKMLDAKRARGEHMRPYMRNANVSWAGIDIDDVKEMDFPPSEQARYRLRAGDLLVCEGGANINVVGKSAIWEGQIEECYYQKALHRVRPSRSGEDPWFLLYALYAAMKKGVFVTEANPNTVFHLTAEKLRRHRFGFPPPDEQTQIVSELKMRTARLDQVAHRTAKSLERLREYRQAVITAAVTGKLDVSAETLEDAR